jgi:hypothetical protein
MLVILAVLVFDSAFLESIFHPHLGLVGRFFAPQTQAFVEKAALSSLQTV